MVIRLSNFVILVFLLISPSFAKTLIIGLHERPVYREKTDDGGWQGVDIDLVEAIFKEAAFDYELVEYPWRRTLQGVESGKVDVALSAAKTENRKKFALFTEATFRPGHNVLFIDKQKASQFRHIHSLDDISATNFKLGVLRGVSYSDSYDELLKDLGFTKNLVILDNADRLPLMLLKGRIDGYLDSEFGGAFRIKGDPRFTARIEVKTYITSEKEAETFLMFSRNSMTEQDVEKVLSEGLYEEVLARYGLKPGLN